MRRLSKIMFAALAFSALAPLPAHAQHRLFAEDSELQLTIEGPISTITRTAARSTDALPAVLTLAEGAQNSTFQIQLSPRGFTRRTGGYCTFPPLRLDFDSAAVRGTFFAGQNKLKLVTRCQSDALVVLEYTAYRLYNELTPLSFRVRPARVTYRNAGARPNAQTQFNFLIEDADDLARRNHRAVITVGPQEVPPSALNGEQAALVALFQLMIGDLDWEMVRGPQGEDCCHNGKLLAATEAGRADLIPVPYDFDYSGFVAAPYAVPPANIRVNSVRTRYYRGYCIHNPFLSAAAERFRTHRAALYAIIDNEQRLNAGRRQQAHRYIDGFFEILDNPAQFNNQVVEHCRGPSGT